MNRRFIFILVIAALLLNLAVGAKIYLSSAHAANDDDTASANVEIFSDALQKIRKEYVDGKDLTYQQLSYAALKGMVAKLDPHSEFLDADSFQELKDDTEGQFGGLGITVELLNGHITVIAPMAGSPGARAGILPGDRIVRVEGVSIDKQPLTDVVKLLRGQPDTKVTITLERPSTGAVKELTLTRAVIQMDMVKDINDQKEFPLSENKLGYVRIVQFGEQTAADLETALDQLKRQGMKGLILDLRWNPGGLLEQAVEVSQKFLPRGQLVVSTEGRHTLERYYAQGEGDELKGIPVVILANLGSASAAEIVTGCLKDLRRAVVLGERTFGKGSVQTIFPLDDGSALKLTVAKYYTPAHNVIHQRGIMPDILVPITDYEEAVLFMQHTAGSIQSLPAADRARAQAVHDEQFNRAEDLLKALLIYDQVTGSTKPGKMAAK